MCVWICIAISKKNFKNFRSLMRCSANSGQGLAGFCLLIPYWNFWKVLYVFKRVCVRLLFGPAFVLRGGGRGDREWSERSSRVHGTWRSGGGEAHHYRRAVGRERSTRNDHAMWPQRAQSIHSPCCHACVRAVCAVECVHTNTPAQVSPGEPVATAGRDGRRRRR